MSDINHYTVQGMTCASCATKVSTVVSEVPGVIATGVDLAAGTLKVNGPDAEDSALRAAIAEAGYQVS